MPGDAQHRRLDWFIPSWLENYDAFEETENENFTEIGFVTITQVVAALCFFVYFTRRRWKDPTYFSPKRLRQPPEMPPPQEGLLTWVWYVAKIPDSEFLKFAGFDALVYIRFYLLAVKVSVAAAVYCWLVILPINLMGDYYLVSGSDINDFSRMSMSNIAPKSNKLWAHVVGIYYVTVVCFFFLNGEFKTWTKLRHQYLKMRAPHMRTILLEDLPADMRSNPRLYLYFNTLYPNSVLTVACTQDLRDLSRLISRRDDVVAQLERAMVRKAKTGKSATTRTGLIPCTGKKVDLIEHLTEQLQQLNNQVSSEQARKLQQLRLFDRRMSRAAEGIHSMHVTELLNEDDMGPIEHYLQRTQAPVMPTIAAQDDRIRTPSGTTPVATPASAGRSNSHATDKQHGSKISGDRPYINSDDEAASNGGSVNGEGSPGNGLAVASITEAGGVVSGNSMDYSSGGIRSSKQWHTAAAMETMALRLSQVASGLTGSSAVDRTDDLDVSRRQRLLDDNEALSDMADGKGNGSHNGGSGALKVDPLKLGMAPKAYVTFKTFSAATIARQVHHASMPGRLKAYEAPEPRDIYWRDTYVTRRARLVRRITVETFLALLYIFYVVPVTLLYLILSEDALVASSPLIASLCEKSSLFEAMIEVIQPIALLCLMSTLPPLIRVLGMVEGVGSESYNQQLVLSRYFYFQVINVFLVTTLAGSVFDTLSLIIKKPSQTFELLGESLPKVCGFFCEYIIIKMLAGLWIEMSRSISAMQHFILKLVWHQDTPRDRSAIVMGLRPYHDAGWFNFPKYYAQDLLVVVVTLTYACINPFILLISGLYFLCAHITYKHQMLYVYEPAFESGGIFFPKVFRRFIFAIFIAQATMVGVLILKEGYYEASATGVLMVATWIFKGKQRGTYEPVSLSLPLEMATSLDLQDEQSRSDEAASKDAYLQPELKAEPVAAPDLSDRDFNPPIPFGEPPVSPMRGGASAPPGLSPTRAGGKNERYRRL